MAKDIFVRSASDIEQMCVAFTQGGTDFKDGLFRKEDSDTPLYNAVYAWGYSYANTDKDRTVYKETIVNLEEELAAANHELQNTKACLIARNAELGAANATIETLSKVSPPASSPQPSIKVAVDRFLGWKLPKNFYPDSGISFKASPDPLMWPIGTNLFTADQAKAMFEFCLEQQPEKVDPQPQTHVVKVDQSAIEKVTDAARKIVRESLKDFTAVGIHLPDGPHLALDIDSGAQIFGGLANETFGKRHTDRKHNHYFRPFPFADIDIYRLCLVYEVTDPCAQHAIKKLLAMGRRGHKDAAKDVQDVIDTMARWQELRAEEGKVA